MSLDLAAAMLFVATYFGVPVPATPPVLVKDQADLPCPLPNKKLRGAFCHGVIWLGANASQATLVHEVVHYFQMYYRIELREHQAYQLERHWQTQQLQRTAGNTPPAAR